MLIKKLLWGKNRKCKIKQMVHSKSRGKKANEDEIDVKIEINHVGFMYLSICNICTSDRGRKSVGSPDQVNAFFEGVKDVWRQIHQ